MTEHTLIDTLVNELKPQKPLTQKHLFIYGLLCFITALGVIALTLGIRQDYHHALRTGSFIWKPLIFALFSISGIFYLNTKAMPARQLNKFYFVPALLGSFLLLGIVVYTLLTFDYKIALEALTDNRAVYCFFVVTIVGCFIYQSLWRLWLVKSAPESSFQAGFIAGYCSGFIAASAYAFHCAQDHPLYIILYYGSPILLVGLMGGFVAKKYLTW
jgi:hypothetical protein